MRGSTYALLRAARTLLARVKYNFVWRRRTARWYFRATQGGFRTCALACAAGGQLPVGAGGSGFPGRLARFAEINVNACIDRPALIELMK